MPLIFLHILYKRMTHHRNVSIQDWAWILGYKPLWVFFAIPTVLLAFDFVYVTGNIKVLVIDFAHYLAQFIWVVGNVVWAGGDLFYDGDAEPIPLFVDGSHSFRWWASWIVACALIPIVWLYGYYIPINYRNKTGRSRGGEHNVHRQISGSSPLSRTLEDRGGVMSKPRDDLDFFDEEADMIVSMSNQDLLELEDEH